jgi:hypothetical protein
MFRMALLLYAIYQWLAKGDKTWGLIAGAMLLFQVLLYFLDVSIGLL